MKRLAIGIALVATPLVGCDKEEDKKAAADGEKGKAGGKEGDKAEKEADKGSGALAATPADALKLVPDGPNVVVGFDAAKVASTALFKDNKAMLEQGDVGEFMTAAAGCKLGMDTWKYALMAGSTEDNDAVVAFASAAGVGKKETLDCIGKKVKEKKPESKFEVSEEDGRVVVTGGEDGEKIYALSDDVVALVGKDLQDGFVKLVKGEGKGALEGSLKDVGGAIDQKGHIYMGMVATADMQKGETEGLKFLTASADLSSGLGLTLAADFGDAAKAKDMTAKAQKAFDEGKAMAGMLGVPKPVVDSVKIETKGNAVAATAKATEADLKTMSETAKKQMAGGAPPQ